MPTKAFLHKKSLLDQFKDDYKNTGYIQSARAEHTWSNPLTRRKRTNKLNGWIKSFQGKRHVHKLARFNAMQNENLEEAMSLKGFLSNIGDKLVNKYGLDKNKVQNYLGSHTQEMQELLNDKELSLKEKVLFVRSEITGEQDEKKSEKLVVSNPCVVYKGDAENAAKAHDYLYKKMPRVKGASISSDVKPLGNNKFCRVLFYGNNTGVMDLFGYYSNLYNDDFWNNCDADPQGWVDPLTINRYDVMTPTRKSKESLLTDKPWQVNVEYELDGSNEYARVITSASSESEAIENAVDYIKYEYEGSTNIVVKDAKPLPKHKSERLFNKREMERIALSEGSKVSPYLVEIAHKILKDEYGWKASTLEEVADWLGDHKQAFEHAYGQALRNSDDDKANVKAGIEAALDEEEQGVMNAEIAMMGESKKSEFYMDGDDSEDYYYCHRCGRVTPSYELDAHGGFCSDCDARWTAEHENESKDTDEKLGYEKGHKNSKGEDAPWVIRSHKDNRILASFATEDEAKEHMKRMKQYSKQEAYVDNSATAKKDYVERVISAVQDYYGYSLFNAKNLVQSNYKKVLSWFESGNVDAVEAARCLGGKCEPTKKSEANSSFDAPIKDWYKGAFKEDDLGDRLNGTFKGVLQTLLRGDDVYTYIGVVDSIIRERLFDKLSKMLGVNYNEIYYLWLNDGAASNELTSKLNKVGLKRTRTTPTSAKDMLKGVGRGVLPPKIIKVKGESKKSEAKEVTEDEGKEALRKLSKRGKLPYGNKMRTDGLSLSRIADEIRYDVATALDMAVEACEDAMLDYGYDRIYVAIADGKTPAEVAADIKSSKKTESTDDLRSRMKKIGYDLLENGNLHSWEYDFIKECLDFSEFKRLEQYLIRKGWYNTPTESKKSEGTRLELEDTLQVPEWLWKAYNLNDTSDLEEDEIEKLNDFREKYKNYHLDDKSEDPYFSSRNDFDELGGNVYDVDAYKMSDKPTEKKNEAYVDVIESPGARKIVKTLDWTCKKCGKPGARIADYDKDGNRVPGFFCNDCYKKMLDDEKSESIKDFPDGTNYKFTFGFHSPKIANIAKDAAEKNGYVAISDKDNNVSIWTKDPQDAIRFADTTVNLANEDERTKLERSDVDKAFAIAIKNKDYSENKETIDNATAEYAVVVHPFESFDGFSVMGELTDVVDFLEAVE